MKTFINTTIVTLDRFDTIIKHGYIRINSDQIIEMGPMDQWVPIVDETVHDMNNTIVMPGLINAHTHLGLIPLRSLKDDMPDRLRLFLFPMEQKYMSEQTVRDASLYGALESLLNGTTTLCDMYYYSNSVCEVLDEVGVRAFVGQTIVKDSQIDYQTQEAALNQTKALIRKWRQHPLITPMIAPHGTTTLSEEILIKIHDLSKQTDTKVMMHVSEMDYEMRAFLPMSPIEYLNSINMLDDNFIAVHVIHTNNKDIKLLAQTNTSVVSCPAANMKAGKGIVDVKSMIEHGICVGLGTDGPISGNTLDLMSTMRLTGYAQKTNNHDRALLSSKELLKMATINSAQLLGIDHLVGSLEINKKADLLFVDTTQSNMFPIHDVEATLVYQFQPQNVHTVIVNGVIQVSNHKLVNYDLNAIKKRIMPVLEQIASHTKNI
ncbi:hypothetical protein AOC36_05665 [Erysipelothrix larvae]|uniref:Amidohydrolase-related domain-containing protein n=1 Tax=Erysipelothrix larvae TaxID=1514105 RepID=A0A0X8H000_9FIRM|nr:amidohydrolase [Erysipelothrix larvae]AMC93484.1 hypothetical protein AOC36_05665 [Erysipelothrix larvae]